MPQGQGSGRKGGGGPKSEKWPRSDFPNGKIRFPPRKSLWSGGGGLARGHGVGLLAFGGAYWPLTTAHPDPLFWLCLRSPWRVVWGKGGVRGGTPPPCPPAMYGHSTTSLHRTNNNALGGRRLRYAAAHSTAAASAPGTSHIAFSSESLHRPIAASHPPHPERATHRHPRRFTCAARSRSPDPLPVRRAHGGRAGRSAGASALPNSPPESANLAANESAARVTRLGGRDQNFGVSTRYSL